MATPTASRTINHLLIESPPLIEDVNGPRSTVLQLTAPTSCVVPSSPPFSRRVHTFYRVNEKPLMMPRAWSFRDATNPFSLTAERTIRSLLPAPFRSTTATSRTFPSTGTVSHPLAKVPSCRSYATTRPEGGASPPSDTWTPYFVELARVRNSALASPHSGDD